MSWIPSFLIALDWFGWILHVKKKKKKKKGVLLVLYLVSFGTKIPSWVYEGICNYSFWSLEGPLRKLVTISVKDAQKFESTNINWDQRVWKKILLRFFIGNYTCTQWVLIPPTHPPSCVLQGEEASFELDLMTIILLWLIIRNAVEQNHSSL